MVFQALSNDDTSRRHPLPQEFVDNFKRERVALALSAVVHDAGFRGLTVSTLAERAKMSRNTFYGLFDNREAAIRFALALGNAKLKKAIDDGAGVGDRWPRRVEAVVERLLDTAADDSHLSELCLVHGRCAADTAAPFDTGLVQALAGVIRSGRQNGPKPDCGPRAAELVAYGVLAVVAERLRRDEAKSLRGLAGELSELVIMSFREVDPLPITS